jgi:hypothetical protein
MPDLNRVGPAPVYVDNAPKHELKSNGMQSLAGGVEADVQST